MMRLKIFLILVATVILAFGSYLLYARQNQAPHADELTSRTWHCVATDAKSQLLREVQGKTPALCGAITLSVIPYQTSSAITVTLTNPDFGFSTTKTDTPTASNMVNNLVFAGLPVDVNKPINWYIATIKNNTPWTYRLMTGLTEVPYICSTDYFTYDSHTSIRTPLPNFSLDSGGLMIYPNIAVLPPGNGLSTTSTFGGGVQYDITDSQGITTRQTFTDGFILKLAPGDYKVQPVVNTGTLLLLSGPVTFHIDAGVVTVLDLRATDRTPFTGKCSDQDTASIAKFLASLLAPTQTTSTSVPTTATGWTGHGTSEPVATRQSVPTASSVSIWQPTPAPRKGGTTKIAQTETGSSEVPSPVPIFHDQQTPQTPSLLSRVLNWFKLVIAKF